MRIGFANLGEVRAGAFGVEMQAYTERHPDDSPIGERVQLRSIDADAALISANLAERTARCEQVAELMGPAATGETFDAGAANI